MILKLTIALEINKLVKKLCMILFSIKMCAALLEMNLLNTERDYYYYYYYSFHESGFQ